MYGLSLCSLRPSSKPCLTCKLTHKKPKRPLPCCHAQTPLGSFEHYPTRRKVVGGFSAGLTSTLLDSTWFTGTAASEEVSDKELRRIHLGFEDRVTEFTLPNGLTFIVLARNNAPVVSCHTYANVGAFNEVDGQTGLAHLLEHMAFKGGERIGSKDYVKEAPLLDALDEVFYSLRASEALKGKGGSKREVEALTQRFAALQQQAADLVEPNAFGALLQREGGVALNATTSQDETRYFVSLPANKLELWFAMEAERFQAPVFRGLYSEKRVIEEERRMVVENSPIGRFQQEFMLKSLTNNYRRPVIGFEDDFAGLGRREVEAFFQRYYGPSQLTIGIVGDTTPDEVYRLATKYFGGWATSVPTSLIPEARAQEALARPTDPSTRFLSGSALAGPLLMMGYYRPAGGTAESLAYEVATSVLCGGRTSRLISQLVLTQRVLSCRLVTTYPSDKHPCLSVLYARPKPGDSLESCQQLITGGVSEMLEEGVSMYSVNAVVASTRSAVLAACLSNSSLASLLAYYHVNSGSWKGLLGELDIITSLTPTDVIDAARLYLTNDNTFIGHVYKA